MRTGVALNGKAKLAYTEWGHGGASIIALHPGVGDRRIWKWCAPTWAKAGNRVVAYDRRGFGDTRYEVEDHDEVSDLSAVAAATHSRPAVIVGNSRGGGLALDTALEHPDLVSGLVLVGPSCSGYNDADWPLSAAEAEQDRLTAAAEEAGDLDLVNRLEVRYWLDGTEQPERRVDGAPRDLMLDMNRRALLAEPAGDAKSHPPAWPRLKDVPVPVLVLAGEHDLPGIILLCERLADALPNARMESIAGTAHCPSLDQPEQLSELVLEFLDSV